MKKPTIFDSDFKDIFDDFGFFDSKFFSRLQKKMNKIIADTRSGVPEGTHEFREIKEPDINGFVIIGRFGTNKALERFQPLRRPKRKPEPGNPFELPGIPEVQEPLTDIYEQDSATKIYVELLGEEEEDIVLKATQRGIEIKAKRFHKAISLPNSNLATDKMTTRYKNGVFEVTIPKNEQLHKRDKESERAT